MNVLHLIGGSLGSGAAKGAYQLHRGLLEMGVDSRVLTNSIETFDDPSVVSIASGKIGKVLSLARCEADIALQLPYRNRRRAVFHAGVFGYDFTRSALFRNADIVHMHWVCGGLVNIRHLAKADKKMVWTLRDMWPMTGGCHYAMACDRYRSGCGRCPILGSHRNMDLSRFVFKRKQKYLPESIKLVGISHWVSECAEQSLLFRESDVRTFHNNIDTRDFSPVEKRVAREILQLPTNRRIILVGAQRFDGEYKGFDLCFEALNRVEQDALVVFFGSRLDPARAASIGRDYVSFGYLHDSISLRLLYSAADVFLASSRMEAFGKTLAEAMACGTPVVCFDATGPKDIVSHEEDGYKAEPFDICDLARGVDWVLEDEGRRGILAANARTKVVEHFDTEVIAKRYLALYEEIMDGQNEAGQ